MIISQKHRYVFVELAQTGSTAISRELRDMYDGEKIYGKHTPYHRFYRNASEEERNYYTFAAVRNPLDVAVTKYAKYKADHRKEFTDPEIVASKRGIGNYLDRRIQRLVVKEDLDFSEFFLRIYRFPFNTWACLDHARFDYVMKYENLQEDFSNVLDEIGIEQVRPLPVVNSTTRKRHFASYYSPAAIDRAKSVFAGYIHEWGYRFPDDWGQPEYTAVDQAKYRISTSILKLYWRHLKHHMWVKK